MKKSFWKCSVAVPLVTAMLISQCHIVLAENLNSSESKTTIINEEERIESMQTKMLSTILSAQEESIQADNRANVAIQRRKDNISSIDNHFKEKQAEQLQASTTENAEIIISELPIQESEQTVSPESIAEEEDELVPTNNLIPKHYISGNNDSIISTSTGDLVRIEKIVDLPVAGDITMSLNLKYDSGTPAYSEDYSIEGKLRACPVYGVAAGWGFDIPYIREATLYIPELGTYELNSSEGKVYFNNTEVKYLSFYKRRSGGVDYIDVYTKDGVTYSFANSEIRKVTDKYGNYVTYSTDGTLLWGMTDSLGRSVSISYTNDIVVTLPNSQTITLIRESEIVRPSYGVVYDLTLLTSVKRSVANNSYVSSQYEYTLANGLDDDGYLMTALMSYAVNTQYGANYYYYEAAPALSYVSSGNYDLSTIFRITENNIVDSDGYTVDWIYYDYEGNHTGYTSDTNTSDIPGTYTYSVHVHSGSTSTKYEYTVTAPQRDDDGYFIYPEDRVKTYTHKRYDDYDPPQTKMTPKAITA